MKLLLLVLPLLLSASLHAQTAPCPSYSVFQQPFKGHYFCKETGVNMYLNLYEEDIEVPGFSFLGKMHGYMRDGIYGIWMIVQSEVKDNKALIRFSNDIGSDSQDIEFTQQNDSTFIYQTKSGNAIRKAIGRKLEKVTGRMVFIRK